MRSSETLKPTRSLTNHVFATYTFSRNIDFREAWGQVNTNFNRHIQRFRRLHTGGLHYIRTVEAHKDDYPHIHAILQFHDAITVNNARYFDSALYQQWKGLWRSGLSDYQPPLSRQLPILYIIKYITKSHATKTIWRKLLSNVALEDAKKSSLQTTQPKLDALPASKVDVKTPAPTNTFLLCQQFKIKQCTWSRGFKFPALPKRYSFDHSLDKFNN